MGVLCVVFSIHRVFLTCDLYVWFYTLKKICSKAATVKAVKVVPQPGGRDELQDLPSVKPRSLTHWQGDLCSHKSWLLVLHKTFQQNGRCTSSPVLLLVPSTGLRGSTICHEAEEHQGSPSGNASLQNRLFSTWVTHCSLLVCCHL